MKPLTKEQQNEALRLLNLLVHRVTKYSVSHAPGYETTPQHRLHDSLGLATATADARKWVHDLDYENTVAGIRYEVEVLEALTEGRDATRRGVSPTLTDEEKDEIREAFENGTTAADFAQKLFEHDVRRLERQAANKN